MPLPSIGGGTGRGVFVYKSAVNHETLPQSDLNYLKDQYNKGAIALVHNTTADKFYRYENVGGTWTWNERGSFASGSKGADGVGITNIIFKQATTAGDVYTVVLSDGSTYDITAPKGADGSGDSKDLIKIFGDQATDPKAGRIRYDDSVGHWIFEVKQPDGSYKNKLEVGGSIMVDVLRLIQGEKPTNIPATEMGLYMANVSIGGVDQIRPYWVLSNGNEYGVVVHDEQTGKVVYRQKDGQLGELKTVAEINAIERIAKNGIHTLDFNELTNTLSGRDSDGNIIENIDLSALATGGVDLSDYMKKDLEDVDLTKLYNKGIDAKLADGTKQKALEAEVNRLKTDVSTSDLPIYSWRGRGIPTVPNDKPYKAYYIHSIVLQDSNGIIDIPSNAPDGATFSIENNDRTDYVNLRPPVGETISGNTGLFKCNFDTLNFFVKDGTNWVHAFGGIFPNTISSMISTIKANLPAGSLNTIAEIQAQLKDRLHTFREIQNEFANQLHTFDEIDTEMGSRGFSKHSGATTWTNMDGSAGGRSDAVMVEEPLQAYVDPNSPADQDRIKLRIKHGYYEHKWSSGYLAYANDNVEIVGRRTNGTKMGKLWFDDEVVPGGTFVYPNKANKAITIQETDTLDPNITGGTDFLVAYRVALKGTASDDGFVKIYLRDRMSGLVIDDVNGNPFMVKRKYKQGDVLGYLEWISVINAKGVKDLEMIVEDDFITDTLVIEDRTQGVSGIMVQALSTKGKTGRAMLDYEVTTMQAIEFTHHYYGEDFMSIDYLAKQTQPITTGAVGEGMTTEDGFHFYNTTPMNFGVQNGYMVFEDDGTNLCYFNFGKIFNAENTYALRGKQINLDITLVDKSNGFIVQPIKWSGLPNEYTRKVITDESGGNPVLEPNWTLEDGRVFIPEDVVSGDHKVTSAFTVPDDAVNFGVIIYPVAKESPMSLKLKQFTASVNEPFNGWTVHSPHLMSEEALKYSKEYLETGMNSEGYAGLRFTVDALPTKMPVGYKVSGNADIEVYEAWQVGVKPKGEGVFKFNKDGLVNISPTVRIHRGEKAVGDQTITFEWKKRVRNIGNPAWDETDYDTITNSRFTHVIKTTDTDFEYVTQPSFEVEVEAGDLIGFWLHADVDDGAYIQSDAANQNLIAVEIDFDEITAEEKALLENMAEIRFSQAAKDAGVYVEVDYDPNTQKPSISTKIS